MGHASFKLSTQEYLRFDLTTRLYFIYRKTILSIIVRGLQHLIMTLCSHLKGLDQDYVPAVAVIRRRLVLFIFSRFKGYLDGLISHL